VVTGGAENRRVAAAEGTGALADGGDGVTGATAIGGAALHAADEEVPQALEGDGGAASEVGTVSAASRTRTTSPPTAATQVPALRPAKRLAPPLALAVLAAAGRGAEAAAAAAAEAGRLCG